MRAGTEGRVGPVTDWGIFRVFDWGRVGNWGPSVLGEAGQISRFFRISVGRTRRILEDEANAGAGPVTHCVIFGSFCLEGQLAVGKEPNASGKLGSRWCVTDPSVFRDFGCAGSGTAVLPSSGNGTDFPIFPNFGWAD